MCFSLCLTHCVQFLSSSLSLLFAYIDVSQRIIFFFWGGQGYYRRCSDGITKRCKVLQKREVEGEDDRERGKSEYGG